MPDPMPTARPAAPPPGHSADPAHRDGLADHHEAATRARTLRAERPGERPGRDAGFDYDLARHTASYRYGATLVRGKRVLDAGCGDGVGSRFLAATAAEVVGVDHSAVAVAQCRRLWLDGSRPNLRFEIVDLASPGDFHERFDVILNIQVFEHIADPLPFLRGLRDRLSPGGILVISTPNRLRSVSENPFHVHEYTCDELGDLLKTVFDDVKILGLHGNDKVERFEARREKAVKRILRLDPLGIRNLLPRSVVEFAFAHLARLVRRQSSPQAIQGEEEGIQAEDFSVSDVDIDRALDLLAICSAGGGGK